MRQIPNAGDTATLIAGYYGYSNILLVQKVEYQWEVEICGSGKIIYVYEDDFILD
jgi:hypothetical protein